MCWPTHNDNVDTRHGVSSVPVSLIKGSRENRWDKVKNTPWKTMGRERKVGQDNLLPRQHCLTPPLGTSSTTLWFGLRSRFAPWPADLLDAATIHHAVGERHGRALKELTTGLWSSFTRWEAFGIADANSAVT